MNGLSETLFTKFTLSFVGPGFAVFVAPIVIKHKICRCRLLSHVLHRFKQK